MYQGWTEKRRVVISTYPGGVRHALLLRLNLSRRLKAMRRVAVHEPADGFLPLHKKGNTRTSRCTSIRVTPKSKT